MDDVQNMQVKLELTEVNRLLVSVITPQSGCRYKYYLYNGRSFVDKTQFIPDSENVFWLTEPGTYKVKIIALYEDGRKEHHTPEPIVFSGVKIVISDMKVKKDPLRWVKNVAFVSKELWNNRKRMIRVSRFDHKVLNTDTYLGSWWNIISPIIQVFTYWFVFGVGIRQKDAMGNDPYFIWMLCGLIPWFFINPCILKGANSIFAKGEALLKLQYPITTIPVGTIFVNFYNLLWTMGILIIVMLFAGYMPTVYWLNLIYYMIFAICFLSSLALITSVLTMIARDFQHLLASCMRLLFYMTPILWYPSNMPSKIQSILRMNPIAYISDGFRDSLLYGNHFFIYGKRIIFFWVMVLVLFVVGCNLQMKVRDEYIDLL